jgi:hypothetical protein
LTSLKPKRASVEATAMSQAETKPIPPPMAGPLTRAIVGFATV